MTDGIGLNKPISFVKDTNYQERHMNSAFIRVVRNISHKLGFELVSYSSDFDLASLDTVKFSRPYTMTSAPRIFALCEAVRYICKNNIPGDIVECGVWRGGSMMAAARTLIECGDTSRHLYLYDTFEGMPPPTEKDRQGTGSQSAAQILASEKKNSDSLHWAIAPMEDVRKNIFSTGYPSELIHLVKGKVEETIPSTISQQIAVLRLDTDWYESTRHELNHLYPLLVDQGVLIIDDYGYWQGARQAVDEYFALQAYKPLLSRIDGTGRCAIKM